MEHAVHQAVEAVFVMNIAVKWTICKAFTIQTFLIMKHYFGIMKLLEWEEKMSFSLSPSFARKWHHIPRDSDTVSGLWRVRTTARTCSKDDLKMGNKTYHNLLFFLKKNIKFVLPAVECLGWVFSLLQPYNLCFPKDSILMYNSFLILWL